MDRVVIVGGGFAGLSAAYTLMKRGITPLLLEAKERVGPERSEPTEPLMIGERTVDFPRRRATLGGRPVRLTPLEYRLMAGAVGCC